MKNPDALGAHGVLARLHANEQIIVRGGHIFEFVLGQLPLHLLHHRHLEAVGLPLLIHIVIGHIVVGMGHGDDLLLPAPVSLGRGAAACRSDSQSPQQSRNRKRLDIFAEFHFHPSLPIYSNRHK